MMRPAPAGSADVEQVFEKDRRRTVHGHSNRIGGLDARIEGVDVTAEFVGCVPAAIIAVGAQRRTKRVVIIHERRGARAAILLRRGKRTEIK